MRARVDVWAPKGEDAVVDVVVHWGDLPRSATLVVAFEKHPDGKPAFAPDDENDRDGLERCARGDLFEPRFESRCGDERHMDLENVYLVRPLKAGTTRLPRVRVPGDRPLAMAFHVEAKLQAEASFQLVQREGDAVVGGSTFILRPR